MHMQGPAVTSSVLLWWTPISLSHFPQPWSLFLVPPLRPTSDDDVVEDGVIDVFHGLAGAEQQSRDYSSTFLPEQSCPTEQRARVQRMRKGGNGSVGPSRASSQCSRAPLPGRRGSCLHCGKGSPAGGLTIIRLTFSVVLVHLGQTLSTLSRTARNLRPSSG